MSTTLRRSKPKTAKLNTARALSIRQPWVELILTGQKTIEIRTWKTLIRGEVWLHAARLWAADCPHQRNENLPRGGIVGSAQIIDCIKYKTKRQFRRHAPLHRVPVHWWTGPVYGFILDQPRRIPFQPRRGGLKFFGVFVDECT